MFPEELEEAISEDCKKIPAKTLKAAREELTLRYRTGGFKHFVAKDEHRLAYVLSRMPATFAALSAALEEIPKYYPHPIKSLIDLGSGPGTALWAAAKVFPDLEKVTLLEQDPGMITMAKRYASKNELIHKASWKQVDLESHPSIDKHDLAVFSYSLGELQDISIIDNCFELVDIIAIIEPGTPKGFEVIRAARDRLIKQGAHIIAPCPHALECPMSGGDWCHFSKRLVRTREQIQAKDGALGYEDEKFSYVIAAKLKGESYRARILRHPIKRSGHISFTLCTESGLVQETISKKQKELYTIARKSEWGDVFK